MATLAVATVMSSMQMARAADFFWIGSDGNYLLTDNWDLGSVPGALDNVTFDPGSGVVDNIFIDSALVHDGFTANSSTFLFDGSGSLTVTQANLAGSSFSGGQFNSTTTSINSSATTTWFYDATVGLGNATQYGSTLEVSNSSVTATSLGLFGELGASPQLNLQGSTLTTDTASLFDGLLSISEDSTFTADDGVSLDFYTANLSLAGSSADVAGNLNTRGAVIGRQNFFGTNTEGTVTIFDTGTWTDTSETAKTIGFGANGNLLVSGGSAILGGAVMVGVTDQDLFTGEMRAASGRIEVSAGGSFEADQLYLGGFRRLLPSPGFEDASSEGTLLVDGTDSTATIGQLRMVDDAAEGRVQSQIIVQNEGNLHVDSGIVGAINLDAQTAYAVISVFDASATFDYLQLIGSGPSFQNLGIAAPQFYAQNALDLGLGSIRLFNGASLQAIDSETRLGGLDVGTDGIGSASATFEGGSTSFDRTIINQTIDINVGTGLVRFKDTPLSTNGIARFQTFFRDGGRLEFDNASFAGNGLLSINQQGTLDVRDSQLQFLNAVDISGVLVSPATFDVGVADEGTANIDNSQVEAWRVRLGLNAGGDATVVLRDSKLIGTSTTYTPVNAGSIIVGKDGTASVELFSSELSGPQIYIGTNGLVKGDGELNGDSLTSPGFTNVINYGTISPGHSPGRLDIDGNLENFGVLEIEIDLANPDEFDRIVATGSMTLGGTLRLKALNTGIFDPARSYTFLTASSILGGFDTYEIDPIFGINSSAFSVNGGNFGINPVPEPASMAAIGLGLLALMRRRRRG
jgi:hypothetical protein